MYRRYQHINIPIEIVRTVVAISETGSLSKAGERLGLSQPAVSSQIKRLQSLVGGSLFVKTANGTKTTELGEIALQQARRILEANDQMLRLGGNSIGPQPLRLGLSTLFFDQFIKEQKRETLADTFVHIGNSVAIGRGLIEGYIDVACIYRNGRLEADVDQMIVNEFDDPVVWVRARDFVLSPGAPIPILTYPGDDWIIPILTRLGISYKIVLNSTEYHARMSAVRAGVGLTTAPASQVPSDLVQARDYYLPPLPPIKALLCARLGFDTQRAAELMKSLSALFFKTDNPSNASERDAAAFDLKLPKMSTG